MPCSHVDFHFLNGDGGVDGEGDRKEVEDDMGGEEGVESLVGMQHKQFASLWYCISGNHLLSINNEFVLKVS